MNRKLICYIICVVLVIAIIPSAYADFVVEFDLNGHGSSVTPFTSTDGTVSKPSPDPVADGYEFGGWFKESTCDNEFDFSSDTVSEDTTLFAKWTELPKVSFDMNGHGTPISEVYAGADGKVVKPSPDPVADGYEFGGWFKESTCDNEFDFSSDTVSEDTTLFAKWTELPKASFDMNGHGTPISEVHAGTDGKVAKPSPDPIADGYEFGGWFKESTCDNEFDFSIETISEDITLYAKWTKLFKITFNMNGHGTQIPATYAGTDGKVIEPTVPSEVGYIFGGWYNEKACETKFDFTSDVVTKDTTLYAKWTPEVYDIEYYKKGGASYSGPFEEPHPTQHTYGTKTVLKPATESGVVFGGWFKGSDCKLEDKVSTFGEKDFSSSPIKLYGLFDKYSITYEPNKGTMKGNYPESYSDESVNIPNGIVERPGYTFAGWYDNKSLSGSPITSIPGSSGDITLYAKWIIKPFTVHLNYNTEKNYSYGKIKYEIINKNSGTLVGSGTVPAEGLDVIMTCEETLRVTFTPKSKYYAEVNYYQGNSRSSSDKITTYYGPTSKSLVLDFSDLTDAKTIVGYFRYYTSRPRTGDGFEPYIWASVMLVSAAGVFLCSKRRKYN